MYIIRKEEHIALKKAVYAVRDFFAEKARTEEENAIWPLLEAAATNLFLGLTSPEDRELPHLILDANKQVGLSIGLTKNLLGSSLGEEVESKAFDDFMNALLFELDDRGLITERRSESDISLEDVIAAVVDKAVRMFKDAYTTMREDDLSSEHDALIRAFYEAELQYVLHEIAESNQAGYAHLRKDVVQHLLGTRLFGREFEQEEFYTEVMEQGTSAIERLFEQHSRADRHEDAAGPVNLVPESTSAAQPRNESERVLRILHGEAQLMKDGEHPGRN